VKPGIGRVISFDASSGTALLNLTGNSGAVFDYNAACTTASASLNAVLDRQVVIPRPYLESGIFVQTFRRDMADYPFWINQDRHLIFPTGSEWFICDLKFKDESAGHWLKSLPTSLGSLPFISRGQLS